MALIVGVLAMRMDFRHVPRTDSTAHSSTATRLGVRHAVAVGNPTGITFERNGAAEFRKV